MIDYPDLRTYLPFIFMLESYPYIGDEKRTTEKNTHTYKHGKVRNRKELENKLFPGIHVLCFPNAVCIG